MLIVYAIVLLLLLLATTVLLFVRRLRHYSVRRAIVPYFCSFNLALFVVLFGPWLYLSIYLKYGFATIYITLLFMSIYANGHKLVSPLSNKIYGLLAFIFLAINITYFTGTTGGPSGAIDLDFPLKSGQYIIFQGGRGLPGNVFHFFGRRTLFAIDLVKLNRAGNRANSVFSSNLDDYCIYGDTVYSPCSGIVVKVENDNPDNIPPSRRRGPTNTNQVLIAKANEWVFMCHFKKGSVMVNPGDTVIKGTPIALAGNSGFSLEPHLHIQAHQRTKNVPWYGARQLLITFSGKEYRLFNVIGHMQQQ